MLEQGFGVKLDLARGRVEAARAPVHLFGKLAVAGFEWHANPAWCLAQILQRYAARCELMPPGGVNVALPELLAKAKAAGEVEDNPDVRARFAYGLDQAAAELDQ